MLTLAYVNTPYIISNALTLPSQCTICTDPKHKDKLVLIEEGTYHGHANRKRGETDPRQCVWRNIGETAEGYTKPIRMVESSTNGICEFQSNHFGKGKFDCASMRCIDYFCNARRVLIGLIATSLRTTQLYVEN